MKLGLFGINMGRLAAPEMAAQAAEAAGYESVWTGEHVVLPEPRTPESPLPSGYPMLDPLVALSYLAAATSRVRLGTGIIILPQRNPVVLAKELASLDVLSKGRLIFGVGVGYLKPEFDAIGAPFAERGARADDYLAAIRALWTMDKPAYQGRFVRFSGVVNPASVTAGNTVLSTQVADARIEYRANGYIDEAQAMGWLTRFFLNVLPF